jgi:hypothetical protein
LFTTCPEIISGRPDHRFWREDQRGGEEEKLNTVPLAQVCGKGFVFSVLVLCNDGLNLKFGFFLFIEYYMAQVRQA